MALFVLENTSADQNLNWLLSEGYTIDGVEVLDDDEEGYTGNNSDDIFILIKQNMKECLEKKRLKLIKRLQMN